jgi:molecular chaperone GrpE
MRSGDPRRSKALSARHRSGEDGRGESAVPMRIEIRGEEEAPPPPPLPPEPPCTEEEAADAHTTEDEIDVLREKLLRVGAEFENYKKRQARDFSRLCNQGRRDLVEELLVVLDNFDRAEEHRNEGHSHEEIESGLTQTLAMLRSILEREGLSVVATEVMDPFDPNIHEAMLAEDRDDLERDAVLLVLQKGYRFGNELLRPVRVKVGRALSGKDGEE